MRRARSAQSPAVPKSTNRPSSQFRPLTHPPNYFRPAERCAGTALRLECSPPARTINGLKHAARARRCHSLCSLFTRNGCYQEACQLDGVGRRTALTYPGAAAVMRFAQRSGSVCVLVGLGSHGRLCILYVCSQCAARAGDSWVTGLFPIFQRYFRIKTLSSSVIWYSSLLFHDIYPDLDAIQ